MGLDMKYFPLFILLAILVVGQFYIFSQPAKSTANTICTDANGNTMQCVQVIDGSAGSNKQTVGSGGDAHVSQVLLTGNGWTAKLLNALSTTVTSVKSSAGELGLMQCYNPNTSQVYIQVFNVASGSVTLGTTTPLLSIPIGPSATGGFAMPNPGMNFSTAISVAATTTATGSTAPSTATDCNAGYN